MWTRPLLRTVLPRESPKSAVDAAVLSGPPTHSHPAEPPIRRSGQPNGQSPRARGRIHLREIARIACKRQAGRRSRVCRRRVYPAAVQALQIQAISARPAPPMTTNVASLPPDPSQRGELTQRRPLDGQNAQLRGHWAKETEQPNLWLDFVSDLLRGMSSRILQSHHPGRNTPQIINESLPTGLKSGIRARYHDAISDFQASPCHHISFSIGQADKTFNKAPRAGYGNRPSRRSMWKARRSSTSTRSCRAPNSTRCISALGRSGITAVSRNPRAEGTFIVMVPSANRGADVRRPPRGNVRDMLRLARVRAGGLVLCPSADPCLAVL
jgi:hypothetical protein